MGWCDNKDAIIIRDCVENGSYTNFTNANLNYCHRSCSALSFDGYDSYNFHKWSTCKQALEIDPNALNGISGSFSNNQKQCPNS